jgi:hypothetical protein
MPSEKYDISFGNKGNNPERVQIVYTSLVIFWVIELHCLSKQHFLFCILKLIQISRETNNYQAKHASDSLENHSREIFFEVLFNPFNFCYVDTRKLQLVSFYALKNAPPQFKT